VNSNVEKLYRDSQSLQITSFGAATDVGRSCFLIESDGRKILLDAGLQLNPKRTKLPSKGPIGIDEIADQLTAVVLSHAHLDHSGYIPALFEQGFNGTIFTTKPTIPLTKILWKDHLKIEGEMHYSKESFFNASSSFKGFNYESQVKAADGVTLEFLDAGHILGSSSVLIDFDGTLIYYSGDINDQVTPFHEPAKTPNEPVDVLLVESTNGGRSLPKRRKASKHLIQAITDSYKDNKKALIPSFALGRSQEVLMYLIKNYGSQLYSHKLYTDGMINQMNGVYEKYFTRSWVSEYALDYLSDVGLDNPFEFDGLHKISKEHINSNLNEYRKDLIQSRKPKIILTTSGMLEGGPILSYLADQNNSGNLLAVVGYQVEGTIGHDIINGEKLIEVETPWGKTQKISINNKIERIGFSGHASQEGLKKFVLDSQPKKVFTIHGNLENQTSFSNILKEEGINVGQFALDESVRIRN
jgi:hypothetical protein